MTSTHATRHQHLRVSLHHYDHHQRTQRRRRFNDNVYIGRTHRSQAAEARKVARDDTASTEAMEEAGEDGGMAEDNEDSAQRLFICWVQVHP